MFQIYCVIIEYYKVIDTIINALAHIQHSKRELKNETFFFVDRADLKKSCFVGGGSHTLHYPALFLTPIACPFGSGISRETHGSSRVQMLPWFLSRPVSDQSRRVEAPHLIIYTALFSGVMMHNPTRHSRLIPDSGRVLGIEFVFILC